MRKYDIVLQQHFAIQLTQYNFKKEGTYLGYVFYLYCCIFIIIKIHSFLRTFYAQNDVRCYCI
jgi:hypothetical protein